MMNIICMDREDQELLELGNILSKTLVESIESVLYQEFGAIKGKQLSEKIFSKIGAKIENIHD